MAEYTFTIASMPHAFASLDGTTVKLSFDTDTKEKVVLTFSTDKLEPMLARIVGVITESQNRTKPSHH